MALGKFRDGKRATLEVESPFSRGKREKFGKYWLLLGHIDVQSASAHDVLVAQDEGC